jgi:SAM-dependent methyltransferase
MKKNFLIRLFYKLYIEIKIFLLKRNIFILNYFFFNFSEILIKLLSRKRKSMQIKLEPVQDLQFTIQPNKKIINIENPEFLNPRGARYDGISIDPKSFINKSKKFFGKNYSHLDLGCGSGSLIYYSREENIDAVGIDNILDQKSKYAFWLSKYKNAYLNTDITKDFQIYSKEEDAKFDLITLWEVFEHIEKQDLPILIKNIAKHMNKNSLLIGSVCTIRDENPLKKSVYHKTVENKDWWISKFKENGICEFKDHDYYTEDMIRGNGIGYFDWDPKDDYGFHIIGKLC